MSKMQHAACVALLMVGAGGLLGWLAGHTDILFADGLRYIEQARADRPGGLGRRPDPIRRPSHLPDGDRGGASPRRPRGARGVAGGGPARVGGRGHPARRAAVPGRRRALRRLDRLARLPPGVPGPPLRPRHGRHAQREHVPALLDLGRLGGAPLPPRGELRLAPPDDRLRGAGLPEPPRGPAAPRGAPGDAPADAPDALDPAELAAMGGRDGLPGARAPPARRPLRGDQGGAGDQAGGRPAARDGAEVGGRWPSRGNARSTPTSRRPRPTSLAVRRDGAGGAHRRDAAAPAARRGGPDLDLAARALGPGPGSS